MRKLIIVLLLFVSCRTDFSVPKYRNRLHSHWHRKAIIIFRQDVYNNPVVYKEARLQLLHPPNINLDKW